MLSGNQLKVLEAIKQKQMRRQQPPDDPAKCSLRGLASRTHLSQGTVQAALRVLVDAGFITSERLGSGTAPSLYRVNELARSAPAVGALGAPATGAQALQPLERKSTSHWSATGTPK